MRRLSTIVLVVGLVAVAAFFARGRWQSRSVDVPTTDSLWYHASDVARLARTGRPQLVEFFHPG